MPILNFKTLRHPIISSEICNTEMRARVLSLLA